MNAKPLVSVICTTFNQRHFIKRCLDSILCQKIDFSIEIILHDDASTDGTTQLVCEYAKQYPDVIFPITQKQNQFSETNKLRISLLDHARGKYIAICDGDDYWNDPLKLAKQTKFLDSHPEFVLCYHDTIDVNHLDEVIGAKESKSKCNYSADELRVFKCGWIPLVSVMHRNVPIDSPPEFNLAPNSDHFLPVLLAEFGGAGYCQDVLPSAVRYHKNNYFSEQSEFSQISMHLRTHLLITSYFLRKGDDQNTKKMIRTWLVHFLNEYYGFKEKD